MFDEFVKLVRQLYKKEIDFIPLHAPVFRGNESKYVNSCLESTMVSSVGDFVPAFEEKLCEYTHAEGAVAVINGTCALHAALVLVDVKPGDEVLTQSLTFVATANAISMAGAVPVFIDCEEKSLGLSPDQLLGFLQENVVLKDGQAINRKTNRRISAIVPMHTFGLISEIQSIVKVAREWKIAVVEDAAEALGSWIDNTHAGLFGDIGVLSFNGNKVVTSGGGGALLFRDKILAKKAKHMTSTAKLPHAWKYEHDMIAYNYRMPNINAALALAQLEMIDEFLKSKKSLTIDYKKFFERFEGIRFLEERKGTKSNYWLNGIVFTSAEDAESFLNKTNSAGIMTRPLWTPMHKLPMYRDCQRTTMVSTEYFADRVVNIPSGVP